MAEITSFFKFMLVAQAFYAFAITIMYYAVPTVAMTYVVSFSDVANQFSLNDTTSRVQNSLEKTQNVPVVELASLVFYSGNILLDLLLNFVFAVPSMATLVINGLMNLFSFDVYIMSTVTTFVISVTFIMYVIGLLQLITNIRSQKGIV